MNQPGPGGMSSSKDSVTILMAVRNGARHLAAQLASIETQTHPWRLIVSDDGSTDDSRAIVAEFARNHAAGQVRQLDGPRQGPAENFRHLLRALPADARFAAFSDQDDVWLPEKLGRATLALAQAEAPTIWASRVTICDEDLNPRADSPELRIAPAFSHALVQNLLQGNTMVLNHAALGLLRAADAEAGPIVMHDWWAYQLVTGAGGRVIFDRRPSLLYRQHRENVVGAANRSGASLARLRRMFGHTHRDWSRINLAALRASRHRLTPDAQLILDEFARLQGSLPQRLSAMRRGGFHRQGRLAQAALWAAALLGRG